MTAVGSRHDIRQDLVRNQFVPDHDGHSRTSLISRILDSLWIRNIFIKISKSINVKILRISFLNYLFTYYVYNILSVCMPIGQKRAPDLITDGCEPPCGCWELNSGPLEEQAMLLTTEPSLEPLKISFNFSMVCHSSP